MKNYFAILAAAIPGIIFLSACGAFQSPTPSITPSPTATETLTITPTVTFTPSPTTTETIIPTATSTPTPSLTPTLALTCHTDEILKKLKSKITYDEFTLLYNEQNGKSTLVFWFVDPEIDPGATGDKIIENANRAIQAGVKVSLQLKSADGCVSGLDLINPIVVDKNYNGWYSGQIAPRDLPDEEPSNPQQLDDLGKLFEVGFLRDQLADPTSTAPAGSCNWKNANENLHNHFASDRENVGFQFVLDGTGTNVWAQWDVPQDYSEMMILPSIMNVAQETKCLWPKPDRLIFIVVNENGTIVTIGILPQPGLQKMDLNAVQIIYP
jgi:hypothetical protein